MAAVQFQRRVLALSLIAGALAVSFALGLIFSPASLQKRRSEVPLLPNLKTGEVRQIQVEGSEGVVQLASGDKGWSVLIGGEGYPASSQRIESFFDHLSSLRRNRVVSANPEIWASFEVGEGAKQRIKLLDAAGGELVNLIVGKSETGERGDFVRLEGRNEVILTNKALGFYLDSNASFWSHLKFFDDLAGKDIMRISVRCAVRFADASERRFAYTLIQNEEEGRSWKLIEPASQKAVALDNKAVDQAANSLAGFEGSEFVPVSAAKDTGLSAPAAEVLFSTVENKDYRLLIGNRSGENQFYAKVQGGSYLYLIPEWRVKAVLQSLEELKQK